MPTPNNNEVVSLLINGQAHDQWQSYDLESDLMTPADAWHVQVGLKVNQLPDFVQPWAEVMVKVGNDTVLHGRVDEVADEVTKSSHNLSLSGRDLAGILVDCSAPIFVTRKSTLSEIIAKVVRPLGIIKHKIDADSTRTREKINVEPGDKAWDVLQNAAEANGLWPWFSPDGTLIVGGPDYSTAPVASLSLKRDGKGNNIESISRRRNISSQYSQITVLGQTHGTEIEQGKNGLVASAKDASLGFNRPNIVVDHESDSSAVATDRARKLLADGRLSSFDLSIKVRGHRTENGTLWTPGQRVQVLSEPHGLNGIYFLMARRFTGGKDQPTLTELTLKEDQVWVPDAHPHKRQHRRGKNNTMEIINVAQAAP